MNDLHVVFGTGAIGLALVHELNTMSLRVRAVNRSGRADVPEGVEIVAADASDAETAAKAATGAGVVYQCLSPPYHQWARLFPPIQDAAVHAARAAHARYVSFENTYMYGDTHGVLITEETPLRAQTRKGKVRIWSWPNSSATLLKRATSMSSRLGHPITLAPEGQHSHPSVTSSSVPPWPANRPAHRRSRPTPQLFLYR
jgi:hypothetical protein